MIQKEKGRNLQAARILTKGQLSNFGSSRALFQLLTNRFNFQRAQLWLVLIIDH